MSIDTSAPLFTATAEHLIDTVAQARSELEKACAEATVQALRANALERQLVAMTFELRVALNAPAYWKARCEQAEEEVRRLRELPTAELPRCQPEPEPVRWRSRRGRHQ